MSENNVSFGLKLLGWLSVACLFAFLTNNYLALYAGLGGVSSVIIYILFAIGAFYKSHTTRHITLRQSGYEIHSLNLYIIRSLFFAVLFVGLADMLVALLRVEQILPLFFSDENVANLTRPSFVGTFIHFPLILIGFVVGNFSKTLGFTWLAFTYSSCRIVDSNLSICLLLRASING